jgi:hypothetical protein
MLSANGISSNGSNGVHAQLYPACASDYEAAPIDVTPTAAPKPGWTDAQAPYTMNVSFLDSDGFQISLTLRSGDLPALLGDLKMVKTLAIKSRMQKEAKGETPAEIETRTCPVHDVGMVKALSRKTGKPYWSHDLLGGERCFGRERKHN